MFKIKKLSNPKLKNPILIEGLPGMGNVGKITVDFMVESLKAEKFMEIKSEVFPNSVFVNEENLVELPKIELYYKNTKKHSLVLLCGDIQPLEEKSCHAFCEKILDIFQELGGTEIVTIGGIGLPSIPEKPRVFVTGNDKKLIKKYRSSNTNEKIYGVVGPIIGVSGLLLGLSKERKIPAISFLAETFGHPSYLGLKGAKKVILTLNNLFSIKVDTKGLDREIKEMSIEEKNISNEIKKFSNKIPFRKEPGMNYIG
ncbi:MAG: PAC2 family protein [Nanoarchaeota archaeon]|nr:PAC2 family protein [Nanoarchaeota archaeon]